MTVMTLFNEQLKKLPAEKERLMACIPYFFWEATKEKQSLKILRAEKFILNTSKLFICMQPNPIFFSVEECSVNTEALNKYVQSLLDDLNNHSSILHFSISSMDEPTETGRTFEIECTF